jgi:hypothetical protein
MAGKHKNRSVVVVDDRDRHHSRITPAAAKEQIKAGAEWVVGGKKLRLPHHDDQTSVKAASASAIDARGMWERFLELGKEPSKDTVGTLAFGDFVKWVESMNRRYRRSNR